MDKNVIIRHFKKVEVQIFFWKKVFSKINFWKKINFFQNCPKIVHRQPNAFRPKLPEAAQNMSSSQSFP
jgi:hypothetical protein